MQASLEHRTEGERLFLRPRGEWTIDEAAALEQKLEPFSKRLSAPSASRLTIDLSKVEALDTSGAFLLVRMERAISAAGGAVEWVGADQARGSLLDRVRDALADEEKPIRHPKTNLLEEVGATVISVWGDARRLLLILGGTVQELAATALRPSTFRASAVARQMEMAGVRAVPIIALMSFLIGGIIAQQGAFQLQFFGAAIFTVDLVGILTLREVAPLLTAIMVAGRSGSAITAELGSMQMREEIDALRVMGLDPINVLVLPRVLALIIVLPLLGFLAALSALAGAMVTLWFYMGITPDAFLERLRYAIDFSSLLSGLFKAPLMALIIALIACSEGMAVRGSAESLGQHTTAAVVKSIFMVIVVDGVFAIFYAGIDF